MKKSQTLELRGSEIRARLNEIAGLEGDALTTEIRAESDALATEYAAVETRRRAAIIGEDAEIATATATAPDAEHRERIELRGRATLGGYLRARMEGRLPGGALAEYAAACGTPDAIPLDLFEADRPVEIRADTVTPAPGTVGVTMSAIQPFVFAASVAPRLGISMPTVGSGTHVETTITGPLTAGPMAKGAARESSAATLTPISTTPRRISARLSIEAEDIAQIGAASFESALRENLSLALSTEYDEQCINGNGVAPNVSGLRKQLTRPANPTAVATFDLFLAAFAGQIDGTWAATVRDVAMIVNPETYRRSVTAFRDGATDHKGAEAASSYLGRESGGWGAAARMPVTPASGANAKIAEALIHRRGRSGLRTAVHPVWSSIQIDDIYTDSASARRHVSLHVLVGDRVLLVQPAAYALGLFKVQA